MNIEEKKKVRLRNNTYRADFFTFYLVEHSLNQLSPDVGFEIDLGFIFKEKKELNFF